jgi:hypothetical protein
VAHLHVGVAREPLEHLDEDRVLHRTAEVRERRAAAGRGMRLVLDERVVGEQGGCGLRGRLGAAPAVVREERLDGLGRAGTASARSRRTRSSRVFFGAEPHAAAAISPEDGSP